MRCSVRYCSACKWKALPFFLQDLQFPSARDFLWGTANPATKEACCFHWLFVSEKLVFSDTHVRRIWFLCLLAKGKEMLPLLYCYQYMFLAFFLLICTKSTQSFTSWQLYIPLGMLLLEVRSTGRLGGFSAKNPNISLVFVGVTGTELQVCLALSADPRLETDACSFSVSLRRGLWSGSGSCCRWKESSSLSIACKFVSSWQSF